MKHIGITGANGLIGKALAEYLERKGYCVTRIIRRDESISLNANKNTVSLGDLTQESNWDSALKELDTIIHLAARVHVMQDTLHDPLSEYRKVNCDATLKLAHQAAKSGITRFIYLSSIKVNGEFTMLGHPFSEEDPPAPQDAYAISKYEAEVGLRELSRKGNFEVVIIRPPLVYGPGVKANFLLMMQSLHRGIPLPLGAIHNKRSLLGLNNLLNCIMTCIEHPAAANEVFMVSDGIDLSTTELLRRLGEALHTSARLLSVPQRLLEISLQVVGKTHLSQRLLGSLQINIHKANTLLGWEPPYSIEDGLRETAEDFLQSKAR